MKVNDDSFLDLQDGDEVHPDACPLVWLDKARVWLDLLMVGGYWPQYRSSLIHGHSAECPRCGAPMETAMHLLWTCPANQKIDDKRVTSTQKLISTAREQVDEYPCLWLRGMLPATLVTVNTPFPEEEELHFVNMQPFHEWPPGRYFSDGSGGRFNVYPLLRRCGFGIAFMHQDITAFSDLSRDLFLWGVFGALVGEKQSVLRSELFAIVVIVRKVRPGKTMICSDSRICVDTFNAGKAHCLSLEHADLWAELWSTLDDGYVQLTLRCQDLR